VWQQPMIANGSDRNRDATEARLSPWDVVSHLLPGALSCWLAREFIEEPLVALSCGGWMVHGVAWIAISVVLIEQARGIQCCRAAGEIWLRIADVGLVGIAVGMHIGAWCAR
jgi:hypothetical protein